jgi:hypothetical protein
MREILRQILSLAWGEGTENFLSAEYLQEIEMRPQELKGKKTVDKKGKGLSAQRTHFVNIG